MDEMKKQILEFIRKDVEESVQIAQGDILQGKYDFPLTNIEQKTKEFYDTYPKQKMVEMGRRISEAFLHGFISQNRERGNRKRVRIFYQIGQEALVREVVACLKIKGLTPVIIQPEPDCIKKIPAIEGIEEQQIVLWYEEAFRENKEKLYDVCGMIGIGEFGKKSTKGKSKREITLTRCRRQIEDQYVKPSEISFCKVAFPSVEIGEQFNEVFDEVFEMNLEDSEEFEKVQQILIQSLDLCETITILGSGTNETNLSVKMQPILDRENQTNFMNCGGDLNIPYGEVFTTPLLKGTNGLFHVKNIYLENTYFHNLKLWFKDGVIIDYSYENDGEEKKELIEKKLLDPYKSLPIGEFAIGTNTRACHICEKYGLEGQMPILIYEKMGPHIAIGDPCYRGAEEEKVYNLLDEKEITAKYNEKTRNEDRNKYVYKHIDITLPYSQVKKLYGSTINGKQITFLENGKFVLENTQKLNEALEEKEER